jgi:hypothetical protein
MLPIPTVAELAAFKMRPESFYSATYAQQAMTQAAWLLMFRTGITEMPTEEAEETLVNYAIMDLGNQIYLEAPFDQVIAKPFSSESIGSYSYSKSSQAAKNGEDTGSLWFDLAVSLLSAVDGSYDVNSESISMFERNDYYQDADGKRYVLGPADYNYPDEDTYYYINAEKRK